MKYLFAFLLLGFQLLKGATGDIISYQILPDGWRIRIEVENFKLGAAITRASMGYADPGSSGYASTPTPGTTPYLTVVSQGYTGTTLGTKTRTVYVGPPMRMPSATYRVPGTFTTPAVGFTNLQSVTATGSGSTGAIVGDQTTGNAIYVTGAGGRTAPANGDVWVPSPDTGTRFTCNAAPTLLTNTLNGGSTNAAIDQRTNGAGNLVIEFPLAEYVYVDDNTGALKSGTQPTITFPAGRIIDSGAGGSGTGNNALATTNITNNSTLPYRTVKFQWWWPDYQRFTDQVYPRAFAWAPHGRDGKPGIECVVFRATDGTNTVTGRQIQWLAKD